MKTKFYYFLILLFPGKSLSAATIQTTDSFIRIKTDPLFNSEQIHTGWGISMQERDMQVLEKSDAIIGTWLNASGKGHIQIYKQGNKYYGKLVWLKEPNDKQGNPRMDTKNPNATLKSKPLIGTILLHDFVFDDDEWNSGSIYDPQNGKNYKCFLRLKDLKTLNVRGYIGISLLGRTETWTRIN